ncbi:SgcJ/EcaC family oxidoreductase [Nocardia cyriacigeorgica]|uniref:SgcJ/EcaC family oxidoreductase n=1 Tax=Nocardia cyriacigeorgica TaxID=135487 RepID=A0A6P1D0T5_9NOCA|nr:SgcJ/EcaC family oxidoreductase [Nocardia cyriacigeorgica]NEW39513.1 SgcJ/EcaC family oxidoreductase [Nocardia cyriacigeorgica]NEW43927.1 SgcJ/EcaC family oxidoreductase [Nocardia cyriacigeorgica]NEW50002.1 SgcJ/EcaC family oxidoreductase [Nocardia cyriacigeorgica]NEW56475.1 SgcJ/EcaC family oxidoreductase [Nocardia cyriacigeorgica]
MSATTSEPPVVEDTSVDHTADIAAIEQLVADVETGYNTNDAELMISGFTANASAGNAVGTVITGRDALLDAGRRGLAGFLKNEYVHYEVTDITFLRPDIAIAHKAARATTADGTLIDEDPAMVALYVLVKENNRWWVATRHNTPVPAA